MEMSTDRIVAIVSGVLAAAAASGGGYFANEAQKPEVCAVWVQQLHSQAEQWHDELERTRRFAADQCDRLVRHACD